MHVEVDMSAESLNESDGAGFEVPGFVLQIFFIEATLYGFFDRSCYDRVSEAQDFPLEFGIAGAHVAKGHRHGEDPLADDGGFGEDVVREMCSGFRHSSCATTSAEAPLFATEGDEALVLAIRTPEAQESVCEHSTFEKGLEFFSDM